MSARADDSRKSDARRVVVLIVALLLAALAVNIAGMVRHSQGAEFGAEARRPPVRVKAKAIARTKAKADCRRGCYVCVPTGCWLVYR